MSAIDFDKLREGLPSCPSDLAIDSFNAQALAQAETETIRGHVDGCSRCADRIAARQLGFEAFPDLDERKLLSAIRRRLDEVQAERQQGLWQRLFGWLRVPRQFAMASGALAAAAVLVIFLRPTGQPLVDDLAGPAGVRSKGGLSLHVYRQRGDHAEETASGENFHPGDNLRFAVDLPKGGQVSVVGIDARGALYVAWPLPTPGGEKAAADTRRPAGHGQPLPGAVTLDESLGAESFYLVECPAAGVPLGCAAQGSGQPPSCPKGCVLVGFPFTKVP